MDKWFTIKTDIYVKIKYGKMGKIISYHLSM